MQNGIRELYPMKKWETNGENVFECGRMKVEKTIESTDDDFLLSLQQGAGIFFIISNNIKNTNACYGFDMFNG